MFGSFDRYVWDKPNDTTLNLERTILFETNKIPSWLNGLDTFTKNMSLDMAHKSARRVIKGYQIYQKDIGERIRQNILLKQKKAEENLDKFNQEKNTIRKTSAKIKLLPIV